MVLLTGAAGLVLAVRAALLSGLETTADAQVQTLSTLVTAGGPDALGAEETEGSDSSGQHGHRGKGDHRPDPDSEVSWVLLGSTLVWSSDSSVPLPSDVDSDTEQLSLPGGDAHYLVSSEDVSWQEQSYRVVVAVSREELDDTTGALVPALAVGGPVVLLVVAGTIWLVVGRALRPVERIRAEVSSITDDRLDRRVPEPGSRDAVGRLARTMNAMLERLETSRDQQQRFVSDASHELRSPIATLRQSAEVVTAHPDAFEPGEFEAIVGDETLRMQHLVDQLLVLTRTRENGSGALGEVDVDDLALTEASRVRRQGLTVDTSGVHPVRVLGPTMAWAQVVRNLVDNAARHATSTVAVRVDATAEATVRVVVADDGAGVPEADRERIFDRFVRLDEARSRDAGGSGLGLAIVQDLVRGLGGRVWVRTADLGGAEFIVEVPLRQP